MNWTHSIAFFSPEFTHQKLYSSKGVGHRDDQFGIERRVFQLDAALQKTQDAGQTRPSSTWLRGKTMEKYRSGIEKRVLCEPLLHVNIAILCFTRAEHKYLITWNIIITENFLLASGLISNIMLEYELIKRRMNSDLSSLHPPPQRLIRDSLSEIELNSYHLYRTLFIASFLSSCYTHSSWMLVVLCIICRLSPPENVYMLFCWKILASSLNGRLSWHKINGKAFYTHAKDTELRECTVQWFMREKRLIWTLMLLWSVCEMCCCSSCSCLPVRLCCSLFFECVYVLCTVRCSAT